MKITYKIGWWLDVERQGNNIVLSTNDDNGNEIEIIIEDGWLNNRRIKQLIKDLNKLEKTNGKMHVSNNSRK